MQKIAIIGGGISGLSIANLLSDRYQVKIFERESTPGGLVKCDRIDGNLYHKVGGHVFNSRREDVLKWFWNFFDREKEFVKTPRNAIISMEDGRLVGYPIENHAYMMDENSMKAFIKDLLSISNNKSIIPQNFEEFLKTRFGETLYECYFKSYNEKIWRKDLKQVPLSWLEGKLPMPTVEEIIYNNFNHVKEMNMVHSTFYYAKQNGSQFIADRFAQKLDIIYNSCINRIERKENRWLINDYECDKIIFCGNIKDFPGIAERSIDLSFYADSIKGLEYHGTTSVLCEIERNPYSWIYMPGRQHSSHRIICTGNFSSSNNAEGRMTGTIEFTDYLSEENIRQNLKEIPFSPRYIAHEYTEYTYPVQNAVTRTMVNSLKKELEQEQIFLLGRFAEWEYYNMDAAMGAAIDLNKRI